MGIRCKGINAHVLPDNCGKPDFPIADHCSLSMLKIESRLDAVVRGRSYYYSIGAENPLGLGPAAGQAKAVEPDKPGKVNDAPWVDRGGALILFLVIFVNSHVRSFKER